MAKRDGLGVVVAIGKNQPGGLNQLPVPEGVQDAAAGARQVKACQDAACIVAAVPQPPGEGVHQFVGGERQERGHGVLPMRVAYATTTNPSGIPRRFAPVLRIARKDPPFPAGPSGVARALP
jgi:hypothetical protein